MYLHVKRMLALLQDVFTCFVWCYMLFRDVLLERCRTYITYILPLCSALYLYQITFRCFCCCCNTYYRAWYIWGKVYKILNVTCVVCTTQSVYVYTFPWGTGVYYTQDKNNKKTKINTQVFVCVVCYFLCMCNATYHAWFNTSVPYGQHDPVVLTDFNNMQTPRKCLSV